MNTAARLARHRADPSVFNNPVSVSGVGFVANEPLDVHGTENNLLFLKFANWQVSKQANKPLTKSILAFQTLTI